MKHPRLLRRRVGRATNVKSDRRFVGIYAFADLIAYANMDCERFENINTHAGNPYSSQGKYFVYYFWLELSQGPNKKKDEKLLLVVLRFFIWFSKACGQLKWVNSMGGGRVEVSKRILPYAVWWTTYERYGGLWLTDSQAVLMSFVRSPAIFVRDVVMWLICGRKLSCEMFSILLVGPEMTTLTKEGAQYARYSNRNFHKMRAYTQI